MTMDRLSVRSEAEQGRPLLGPKLLKKGPQLKSPLDVCTVDFETRSFLDVRNVGAWRYAEDWTTEILCMSWNIGDGKTGLWIPGIPFPQEVLDHIEAGGVFEAHNVQFERAIWLFILRPQFDIPMPRKWKDTLAVCAYRALPLGLDQVGKALNLNIQKGERGKYLLNTLSKPKWGTKNDPDRIYREDFDLMQELYGYCIQDSDSERELSHTVGDLPRPEYRLWVLDQKINQRGMRLDLEAVGVALETTEKIADTLNAELRVITDEAVQKATQRDKLLQWFRSNELSQLSDLKKDTVEYWIRKDKYGEYVMKGKIPDKVIRAMVIRSQLAKASTRKLEKMRDAVSRDGRVRGLLQYHGAGTGRWAGRLVQPQNFPRATVTNRTSADGKKSWLDMDLLAQQIKDRVLDEHFDRPMEAIASSLRGMFVADPGKVYHVCDFSAVEARVTFWIANCQTGLDVFAKSDAGESEDIYCVTASDLVHFEVKKKEHSHERQLGKITVLGCFAPDTVVLTKRGWVRIVDVILDDKIWDGETWVRHEGLLYQGKKPVIRLAGIGVTPDHMMMTQDGWAPASAVANENGSFLKSALSWASSRLPVLKSDHAEASLEFKSSVNVEMNALSISQILDLDERDSVIGALRSLLHSGSEKMKATAILFQTMFSEMCGRPDTRECLVGVTTPLMRHTGITVDEESKSVKNGMIADLFLQTYEKLKTGINSFSKSTGSTTTETTNPEIYEWPHGHSKCSTPEDQDVYDLLNVGSNHRFFVRAGDGGPVLCASNCGYQMGWEKLQFQAEKDYGVVLDESEARGMVDLYRTKYKEVKWLWYGLNDAAIATVKTGQPHSYNNIVYELIEDKAGRWLACLLPSGRRIWYYEPFVERMSVPWGGMKDSLCYQGRDNKKGGSWGTVRTYGGMLTENVVQAVARDLMSEAMFRVEKAGYQIVMTVHDEIITEDDEDFGNQEEYERLMAENPPWSRGCPIAVEGGVITRYQKA